MGLWVRVAVSYVLVTLGAVLLVEATLIGLSARVITDRVTEHDRQTAVQTETFSLALKVSSQISSGAGTLPGTVPPTDQAKPGAQPRPTPTAVARVLPANAGSCQVAAKSRAISVLLGMDGTVLESSFPQCYPAGTAAPRLPVEAPTDGPAQDSGVGTGVARTRVAWAYAPIVQVPPDAFDQGAFGGPADLLRVPRAQQVATLYTEQSIVDSPASLQLGNIRPLLTPGLVVLGGAVPVGLLFGYLSMRRPVRRLRRLALAAQALADGDLARRIPVSGRDELSQLEADMNRMAQRLADAMDGERELAATRARGTERARIARELHDAVSQELFSLRLLAGGLARALPAGSPLHAQADQLERTAATATREMQAMLLELRPAALAEGGLAGALGRLADAYRDRVGIPVRTALAQVEVPAQREHALLRIAQEALANAVRHGDPTELDLSLTPDLLRVRDNGRGFDPTVPTTGMGLSLMRERAAEVGAALVLHSAPGQGATVEVRLT
jgi:signal transduction histidine kinase